MPISMTKTVTVTGPSAPMLINLNAFRYGVGLIANLVGTGTYSLEVCGQDPKLPNFGTIWNGMDNMIGLTASKNNSLAYPCTAMRINPSALGANSSVSLSIIQAVG